MAKVRFYKKHFHGANIFLVTLVFVTLFNSFLSYRIVNNIEAVESRNISVRILSSKTRFFNFEYTVLYQSDVWILELDRLYETGRKLSGLASFDHFSFSKDEYSYDEYKLSNGISGKIIFEHKPEYHGSCDLLCNIIRTKNNIKRYISDRYYRTTCETLKPVVKVFGYGHNCDDVYALSYGLVLGGTQKFSRPVYENIKLLGLTHLVAVSGFQVVLVLTFLEWLVLKIGLQKRKVIWFILAGILTLIALAGPQPPVIRSAISILFSWSVLTFLGRRVSSFRALLYSGLIMLWLNPLYLWSVSFQLSFLASFAIIFQGFGGSSHHAEIEWLKSAKSLFVTSLYAFLFTLPVILNLAGRVAVVGVVTNFLVIPLIPIISIFNIIGLIPWIGDLFLVVSLVLESIILHFLELVSSWNYLNTLLLYSGKFHIWEFVFYYSLLVLTIFLIKFWVQKRTSKAKS